MSGAETFLDGRVVLHCGDSRDVMKTLADNSIDSFVTDPPYALVSIVKRFANSPRSEATENVENPYGRTGRGFMGQKWDTGETAFAVDFWAECFRVLKPGGHVVAFSGTRTVHRMTCAIEDSGFEIRDNILEMFDSAKPGAAFLDSLNDEQRSAFIRLMDDTTFTGLLGWAYGSGFPKSHDVSKGIDRTLGGEREMVTPRSVINHQRDIGNMRPWMLAADHKTVSDEPATAEAAEWQGWGTALKPAWEPIVLARKPLVSTVAKNVLQFRTGAINVDACRIGSEGGCAGAGAVVFGDGLNGTFGQPVPGLGRWPANIIHDGSAEVIAAFPDSDGQQGDVSGNEPSSLTNNCYGKFNGRPATVARNDDGSAARFFYGSKADSDDRLGSKHPTVKNVDQIQWLCRLVTPKGGTICDPFAGTGTCGEAAFREGFNAVLIEREPEYQSDIRRRMSLCLAGPEERKRESIKAKLGDVPFEEGSLFAELNSTDTPPLRDGVFAPTDRPKGVLWKNNRSSRTETLKESEQP